MTTATAGKTAGTTVRLWRHHDVEVAGLAGVDLGTATLTGDLVAATGDLVARGARRVGLAAVIDPAGTADPTATVRALVLVRELTGHAVVVDWRLRLADGLRWQLLNHLYPPAEVLGAHGERIRREWASAFYLCRFVCRYGPGFVQVRDRRAGDLSCLTIDDPDYLAAIETIRDGAPASAVPAGILDDLTAEGLVGLVGELAWWIPYRVRHWPWPVMTV